jgi:hypothetical protein
MIAIGVAGQKRQGKDVLSDHLVKILPGWERAAFAKNVKRIFCETFNVSYDFVEEWKTKDEPPPGFDLPIRKGLQFIGDGFRKIQGGIWIDLMFRNRRESPAPIISDVRYFNEILKVREVGGMVVLLWRPGFENDDACPSESQILPVVRYLASNGHEGDVSNVDLSGILQVHEHFKGNVPAKFKIDLFIKNNGTQEEFVSKSESMIKIYLNNNYGLSV